MEAATYVTEAATLCDGGCNPMWPGDQLEELLNSAELVWRWS